jgi:hypothetical protein
MLIHSRIEPDKLLHGFFTNLDWESMSHARSDLSNPAEFLQIATMLIPQGKHFKAHRHIVHEINHDKMLAQESWVVVFGSVEVSYFDLDDKFLSKHILTEGDLSYTFFGGHSYKGVSRKSRVYEFKSGPYFGQDQDKVFI